MKICIPTGTPEGKSARIHEHFGSAPYFTLIDLENEALEIIDNANQHHQHGMCHPMQSLAGKDLAAIVTGGMGARAVQKMNEAGIKVFQAQSGTVAEVLRQYKKGGLPELTTQNACAHHGCH